MVKKGTKAWKQEYVTTIYGIDRKTNRLRSVSVQRDGTMVAMNSDGTYHRHFRPGSSPEHEAVVAFGLTDVLSVPESMRENVSYKKKIDELAAKATALAEDGEPTEGSEK
jgi:hypothetical protein